MTSLRLRPRFRHLTPESPTEIETLLKEALNDAGATCTGSFYPGHLHLKIPMADRHFWSPQLHLSMEQTEEGTLIRGLYGPNPSVWAIFFFGYVVIGILFFFAGMWGLTQWSLGLSSGVLWALPVLAVLALSLYLMAQAGQKLGEDQMLRLHHFYEQVIHNKVSVN